MTHRIDLVTLPADPTTARKVMMRAREMEPNLDIRDAMAAQVGRLIEEERFEWQGPEQEDAAAEWSGFDAMVRKMSPSAVEPEHTAGALLDAAVGEKPEPVAASCWTAAGCQCGECVAVRRGETGTR